MLQIAPIHGHQQADQKQQPEQVYDQLVNNVKGALVKAESKVGPSDVGFQQHDDRANKQDDEAPEDEQVHHAGVAIAGADQTSMQKRNSQRLAQPLADAIDRAVRPATSPHQVAPSEGIAEHERLDRDQHVHHGEGNLADVPADLARGHSATFHGQAAGEAVAEPAAPDQGERRARGDRHGGVGEDAEGGQRDADERHQPSQHGLEPHGGLW
jgi:hypothetical protein